MDRFASQPKRNGALSVHKPFRLLSRASQAARAFALILAGAICASAAAPLELKDDDVVAFVGGADVAAAQHTGHLESLLALERPTARCRNFGWEGDTVFAQPRDYNFPPLPEHLRKAGATVIFVQFGRTEVLGENAAQFRAAYEKMLDSLAEVTPRLVLVTPIPFERPPAPLPDLSQRNSELAKITGTIKDIARQRQLPALDLFSALQQQSERFTEDGLQLSPRGHGIVALAFARELGMMTPLPTLGDNAAWRDRQVEALRQLIIAKNRLWFDYWRPQNWAFLGGDRITQPSSRDHRDPKIRWFPAEMQKFEPLIAAREKEIAALAQKLQQKN